MKKWLLFAASALLMTGCSRYTPPEISTEIHLSEGQTVESITPENGQTETEKTEAAAESTAAGEEGQTAAEEGGGITDREPVKVKGIYVSAYVAGNDEMMDNIIGYLDETELNAVVIDFKDDDGRITAPVDSPVFDEIDACKSYIPDIEALIRKLKEHDIYVIARVVAFKDPYLAEQKPEWCLKNKEGAVYRDKKGLAWVDPYKQEVWDYLIEVGKQADKVGFDEVQFDYIRFAVDSTMKNVVFDEAGTKGRSKTTIITEFTEYAYENLAPLGLFVSADVFGTVIGSPEDAESVGQIYGDMAGNLDYICPMIYPSHYGDGNFGLDHPDKYPYETVLGALTKSKNDLALYQTDGSSQAIVRPWLQDFTATYLKYHIRYGDEEIRKQIQAVTDAGYDEWILWSAANKYHYGGVGKAEETEKTEGTEKTEKTEKQ